MISILELFLFILPAYVANAIPVLLGGGKPLDFGVRLPDGKRIFGNSKTIQGFIAGVAGGTVIGGILALWWRTPLYVTPASMFIAAFLLSLGTMTGDAIGSFIKRRVGMEEGKPFILDQLAFLFFALLFAYPFAPYEVYTLELLAVLFIATYILHYLFNWLANKLGLKKVPW